MNYSAPKRTTWLVALILGIVAFVALLVTIPVITALAPWIAIIGLALMLVATVTQGL